MEYQIDFKPNIELLLSQYEKELADSLCIVQWRLIQWCKSDL